MQLCSRSIHLQQSPVICPGHLGEREVWGELHQPLWCNVRELSSRRIPKQRRVCLDLDQLDPGHVVLLCLFRCTTVGPSSQPWARSPPITGREPNADVVDIHGRGVCVGRAHAPNQIERITSVGQIGGHQRTGSSTVDIELNPGLLYRPC